MLKNTYDGENCSIARALEAVGERWTMIVVRELLRKPQRFNELEQRLSIPKNTLTSRLGKLVEEGIVERVAVDDPRDWSTYRLSPKGEDLFPVLSALMAWGDAYYAPVGAPAAFRHNCGGLSGHRLVCATCGESVTARDTRGEAGPGWKRRRTPSA